MKLQEQLAHTLEGTPANLQALSEFIDLLWKSRALQATASAAIRQRKLPAEQVVWMVIGLALFRNQSITRDARQLNLSLGEGPCVPSAAVQGRQRLGDAALEHTGAWGAQASGPETPDRPNGCGGLRVLAVDGAVWSAPDTQVNRLALGCCSNQHGQGSWPQIRAVCLMDTSSPEQGTLIAYTPCSADKCA